MWDFIRQWIGQAVQTVVDTLDKWFSPLFSWLSNAFLWLGNTILTLLQWTLDAVLFIVLGTLYLLLDGVLIALKAIVYGLDLSTIPLQFAAGMGLIPAQAAYFMNCYWVSSICYYNRCCFRRKTTYESCSNRSWHRS